MIKLSTNNITSFVGDVVPIRLISDTENLKHADITWRVEGDAVAIRAFNDGGEYSFSDGALVILKRKGTARVVATKDGVEYDATVSAVPMKTADPSAELQYYIGDMHDHTSMNHNRAQFATHEYGRIEDYLNQINEENLTDFGVISDHAGVTNDYDFFRGFVLTREEGEGNVIVFAGAESEITYAEPDRLGVLHRLSGEIVTVNSAGYADVRCWDDFERELSYSPKPIAIFAHPHVVGFSTNGIWNFNYKRNNTPEMLRVVRGIEMGNGADRKENLLHEYAISAALDAGFRVSTTCASDSHGPKWGYNIMPGKTVIMATERSREAFIDALLNNRFYATESGNVKLRYTVNGIAAPADITDTDTYRFHVELDYFKPDITTVPVSLKVISDYGNTAFEIDTEGKSSLDFTVRSSTARYFYLRLVDAEGRKTWSPPVWCGRAFDKYREPEGSPIDMTKVKAYSDDVEIPKVINGDPFDTWYADTPTAEVVMDMGEVRTVSAIGYYPHIVLRDPKKGAEWTTSMETAGLVSHYRVMYSLDGTSYTECAKGTCQALGAENIIEFAPVMARYIRFDALGNVGTSSGLPKYRDTNVRIANLTIFEPKHRA